MNMLAEGTVEVMPLGRRGRYSLTPGQQRLYLALVGFMDQHGISPTFDEMQQMTGAPRRGTSQAVTALEERGWIERLPGRHRGITLLEPVLRDLKPAA